MPIQQITSTELQNNSVENYFSSQGFSMGMRNRIINGDMAIDYYIHERIWLKIKWGMTKTN